MLWTSVTLLWITAAIRGVRLFGPSGEMEKGSRTASLRPQAALQVRRKGNKQSPYVKTRFLRFSTWEGHERPSILAPPRVSPELEEEGGRGSYVNDARTRITSSRTDSGSRRDVVGIVLSGFGGKQRGGGERGAREGEGRGGQRAGAEEVGVSTVNVMKHIPLKLLSKKLGGRKKTQARFGKTRDCGGRKC